MPDENTKLTKPKVAVVGCGYWGKNLVRNFAALDALAAICDGNKEIANGLSETYDVPVRKWPDLLADKAISAVVLATPAEAHAPMAREALLAGKHVYVEKPIALDLADAQGLVDLAEETGQILMVGHLLQYHPAFLKLMDMVKSGDIGRLQYIYSTRLNFGKIRREEDILWSFAPHDISMILALVGEEPTFITANGSNFLHRKICDTTITQLKFPSGQSGHIFVSWLHPFKEQRLVVIGDHGMLVFDDTLPWDQKLAVYNHKIKWLEGVPEPLKAEPSNIDVPQEEPLKNECQHFLDCCAENKHPRTDGAEGLRVLRVLDAATKALAANASDSLVAPYDASARNGYFAHESAVIDQPAEIGAGTKIWHFSHILADVKIGDNCTIGQNVMIGPDVNVGNNCKIQNNVSLYKGVTLEDGVFCGPSCVFTNVNNPRAEIERKDAFLKTSVRKGVTIGANATIVCGNTIGQYGFIAAGAVVTGDVPAHALMAGVPARRIGWVSHAGVKLDDKLTCPETGKIYREVGEDRLEEISK